MSGNRKRAGRRLKKCLHQDFSKIHIHTKTFKIFVRVRRAGKPSIEVTVAVTGHHLILSSSDTKDTADRLDQILMIEQTGHIRY